MSPQIFLKLILLVTACFVTLPLEAKIISKQNYNYPITDPDAATIASVGLHTPESKSEKISVNIKNRRLEDYADHRYLTARFYPASAPSDQLVFIISGIGGDHRATGSTFLAYQTQIRGVDAVILPNAITQNFVVAASTTGLPGGSAADGDDLYQALIKIKQKLEEKGRRYSRVSLVGYSHGALVAAFIEATDQRMLMSANLRGQALSFDSALLINPPIDLLHGIRVIDARAKKTGDISLKRLIKIALRFKKVVERFSKIPTTVQSHQEFVQALRMRPEEQHALIGKGLQVNLPGAILATQAVDDLGIFPELSPKGSAARKYEERARQQQASRYSFEDYVLKFFTTRAKKHKEPFSLDYLNSVNSLTALTDVIQTVRNIHLMHNMDDLLLTNGQPYWLDKLFGDRALIFPTGGHLGNMWYEDNLNAYGRWLRYGKF